MTTLRIGKPGRSEWLEWMLSLPREERRKHVYSLGPDEARIALYTWRLWARDGQLPPPGAWFVWMLLAGRGFGKTRVGAETFNEWARKGERGRPIRLALVGQSLDAVREVMINGESGIMACSPPWFMPKLADPSGRPRLTWPNGSKAFSYSGGSHMEAERLRGPQHHKAWGDEIRAWQYAQEAWDNLLLGLRLGSNPQVVVTTTPRPIPLIKDLVSRERAPDDLEGRDEGRDVVITRGRTYDNLVNLAPTFRRTVIRRYQNTRLGAQELDALMLDDTPGALWNRAMLEALRRITVDRQSLRRIGIAIDPATTATEESDETGIIVGGIGPCDCKGPDKIEDHGFILSDLSGRYTPNEWAKRAVSAYWQLRADVIVGEVNQGGDMVETIIRTQDATVNYHAVHASRGKVTRAEPVAALYEQGRIHHVGMFGELEDQQCMFVPGEDFQVSPDRADALVWLVTELFHLDDPEAAERTTLWFR